MIPIDFPDTQKHFRVTFRGTSHFAHSRCAPPFEIFVAGHSYSRGALRGNPGGLAAEGAVVGTYRPLHDVLLTVPLVENGIGLVQLLSLLVRDPFAGVRILPVAPHGGP